MSLTEKRDIWDYSGEGVAWRSYGPGKADFRENARDFDYVSISYCWGDGAERGA